MHPIIAGVLVAEHRNALIVRSETNRRLKLARNSRVVRPRHRTSGGDTAGRPTAGARAAATVRAA